MFRPTLVFGKRIATNLGEFETGPEKSEIYFATLAQRKFLRMRSGQAFAAKSLSVFDCSSLYHITAGHDPARARHRA
jgi:hypothetical protein